MNRPSKLLTLAACSFLMAPSAFAQTTESAAGTGTHVSTGITANRVIGDVTGIDQAAMSVTLKVEGAASPVNAALNDKTIYYRAKSDILSRAATATISPADLEKITLAEVGEGDRVVVLGKVAEDQKSVPARILIVATKADIAQKLERDREEWRRRGLVGTVAALNPETKEITVQLRSLVGQQTIVVEAGTAKVRFRRYAPDSVRFSDAKPSSLAEIKVGDQLRARGDKSEDGARLSADEIVTGTFRSIRGAIEVVNPAASEIKIKDMITGQAVVVAISKDSMVRRIPAEFAERLATRGQRGGGRPREADGQQPPPAEGPRPSRAEGGGGQRRPEGPSSEGMGNRRRTGGGPDIQEMLERMPAVPIADLKPGEMVIVSSTAGADPARATAIALVTGVEAFMQSPGGGQRTNSQGTSLGLPSGALDIGIGLP